MRQDFPRRLCAAVWVTAALTIGTGCAENPSSTASNLAGSPMVGVWKDRVSVSDLYRAYLVLRPDGSFLSRQVATFTQQQMAFVMDNTGKYRLTADGSKVEFFAMGRPDGVDCSDFQNPEGVKVIAGLSFFGQELRLDFTEVMTAKFGTSYPAVQGYEPIAELPPAPPGALLRCHPIVTI